MFVCIALTTMSFRRPEHAVVRAGHADVADVRGAAGQDLRVGRRDVRVRAEDEADLAVHVVAEADLFARRLGVDVARRAPSRSLGISASHAIDRVERIAGRDGRARRSGPAR